MKKNFIRKIYEIWIKNNRQRFVYAPWISKSRKDGFTLRFTGIAPELTCRISDTGAVIIIHDHHGQYWDIIGEFETSVKKTRTGQYYCQMCDDYDDCKILTYYPTLAALWEDHIFEEMMEWINGLNSDLWIYLYGIPDETIWGATLMHKCDVEQKDPKGDIYHTSIPLNYKIGGGLGITTMVTKHDQSKKI